MNSGNPGSGAADVLVVGAGPAGLCLSLALARLGLSVTVVERQPASALEHPAFDGREIALTHASMRILRELGVWSFIPGEEVAPLKRAQVMDGDGPGFEVGPEGTGHERLGVLVSNHLIRAAAWRAVAGNPAVRVVDSVGVESVSTDEHGCRVVLEDGRVLDGALLVAADSRFSTTRRAMGIPVAMHDFGKTMLVSRFTHGKPHHGVATEWFGEGQTRALLPLAGNLVSVVLTVPGAEGARLAALPPEQYTLEVERRLEGRLGSMGLASPVHAWPLVATWAHRFVGPRFALAGDAAVGMHPVTAHGFNLGLASVERLAAAVRDSLARHGDPAHPALLARYQRRHRAGSLPLFLGTGAVVGIYTNDRAPVKPVRRGILRTVAAFAPARRALAAGLIDDGTRDAGPLAALREGLDRLRPRLTPDRPRRGPGHPGRSA